MCLEQEADSDWAVQDEGLAALVLVEKLFVLNQYQQSSQNI